MRIAIAAFANGPARIPRMLSWDRETPGWQGHVPQRPRWTSSSGSPLPVQFATTACAISWMANASKEQRLARPP